MSRGSNETVKRNMLRKRKRERRTREKLLSSNSCGFVKNIFVLTESLLGAFNRTSPERSNISGEFRGSPQPMRDGLGVSRTDNAIIVNNMNRKMIRKGQAGRITWPQVGGMVGDRNGGDHNWIAEERKREKEAVYPRGPRMGRRGVGGDMKKSVTFVRGIENLQVNLQTSPGLEEGDRGETGGGRRRVDGIFNKIEVTTNKGVKKVGKSEKNLQKLGVEGVVPGLESNI